MTNENRPGLFETENFVLDEAKNGYFVTEKIGDKYGEYLTISFTELSELYKAAYAHELARIGWRQVGGDKRADGGDEWVNFGYAKYSVMTNEKMNAYKAAGKTPPPF